MTDRPRRYDLRPGRAALAILLPLAGGWGLSVASAYRAGRNDVTGGCIDPDRAGRAAERLNPNTASAASLRRLPQLGPARIRAIVDYRDERGAKAFARAEDLLAVHGIGPATVHLLRPYLALPDSNGP